MFRYLYLVFSLFFITSHAAEITRVEDKEGDADLIFFQGEIKDGDDKIFKGIALNSEAAIVVFDSPVNNS